MTPVSDLPKPDPVGNGDWRAASGYYESLFGIKMPA